MWQRSYSHGRYYESKTPNATYEKVIKKAADTLTENRQLISNSNEQAAEIQDIDNVEDLYAMFWNALTDAAQVLPVVHRSVKQKWMTDDILRMMDLRCKGKGIN